MAMSTRKSVRGSGHAAVALLEKGVNEPRGLDLDCAGGLLVADSGNNRIVRFAGVAPAAGCGSAGTPTAKGTPPAPVGLKLRTKRRASAPDTRLGTITATCARTCELKVVDASVGAVAGGKIKSYKVTTRRTGRTITVSVSAKTAAAMRAAVRAGGSVSAGVIVSGTAGDGVEDTDIVGWTFRR